MVWLVRELPTAQGLPGLAAPGQLLALKKASQTTSVKRTASPRWPFTAATQRRLGGCCARPWDRQARSSLALAPPGTPLRGLRPRDRAVCLPGAGPLRGAPGGCSPRGGYPSCDPGGRHGHERLTRTRAKRDIHTCTHAPWTGGSARDAQHAAPPASPPARPPASSLLRLAGPPRRAAAVGVRRRQRVRLAALFEHTDRLIQWRCLQTGHSRPAATHPPPAQPVAASPSYVSYAAPAATGAACPCRPHHRL